MIQFNIKFSDDPKFQHIGDTLRALAYVFVHHIDLWLKLVDELSYIINIPNITAKAVFNHFQLSELSELSNIPLPKHSLDDNNLTMVANTFTEAIKETPTLKRYVDEKMDVIFTMWDFCSYLFVPVRLTKNDLPDRKKINGLRYWLLTVFTLPFNIEYAFRYLNIIKRYDIIKEGKDKLTPANVEQFKNSINKDWINKIINEYYTAGQFTQEFIRTVMRFIILSSIDIMKHYNCRIEDGYKICKEFDGTWLIAEDIMVVAQNQKIASLTPLVKIKD